MNKEEILAKAQEENKGADLADREAGKAGGLAVYFVGVILVAIVDLINGVVFHNGGQSSLFVVGSMTFTFFLVKYIRVRKTDDLFLTILFGASAVIGLILWIYIMRIAILCEAG